MLSRITGANSGIGNYLREGNKSGRYHSRDQMDSREVLHGDLELTENIIDSIENKGQERYLHVSLSFKEKDLHRDNLEEITEEYVKGLMSAYNSEEYNYYAEAHRPKLQNIYNPSTDTMDERLLHVHVIIPKKNLVSGGRLNPTGRHLSNIEYFDALQERINQKYGLESPRENKRDILKGRTEAIARYSGEFDRTRSHAASMKTRALDATKDADYETFKGRLQDQGEIKIRNKGKPNEYIAVKFEGESRFTNLRESVFSQEFLDDKAKPANQKEIEKTLNYWREIRSREIKYISDASKNIRQEYSDVENRTDKIEYLNQRSDYFYQKHDYINEQEESTDGFSLSKSSASKPSHNQSKRGRRGAQSGARDHSLQKLQERTLVHQQGRTLLLLQGNADTHTHAEEGGTDRIAGLRRPLHGGKRGLVGEGGADSYMAQALDNTRNTKRHHSVTASGLNNVDPRHVIDYCAKHYLIDTEKVTPSENKSGEPRINVGTRNHTNTDYLTKEINLSWPEAKNVLESLYKDSQHKARNDRHITTDEVKKEWRDFTNNSHARKGEGNNEIRRIKEGFSKERAAIMEEYRNDRLQIKAAKLSRQERIYQTALSVRQKMVRLETLEKDRANTISAVRNSIKPFGASEVNTMENLKAWEERQADQEKIKELQDKTFNSHDAAIRPSTDFGSLDSVKRNMENSAHNTREVATPGQDSAGRPKISINDLGVNKTANGADFTHNDKVVFRDHGSHVSTSKDTDQEMAEVTLSYAVNRYGSNLDVKGSDDFKDKIVQAAFDKNLKVEFTDQGMNEKLQAMNTLKNDTVDHADKIADAFKSAQNLQPMDNKHLGNDDIESCYRETLSARAHNAPAHEVDKAEKLSSDMTVESARHRGRNLMAASAAIASDTGAANVYETNLRGKVMADSEELHFIQEQKDNGKNVPDNPNLRSNIEKGEELQSNFAEQRHEAMRENLAREGQSNQGTDQQKGQGARNSNRDDHDFGMD